MKSAARPDPLMTTTGVPFEMASAVVFRVWMPPSRTIRTSCASPNQIQHNTTYRATAGVYRCAIALASTAGWRLYILEQKR